jgi:PKD repeat protein
MRKFKLLFLILLMPMLTLYFSAQGQQKMTPNTIKTPVGFAISNPLSDNPIVTDVEMQTEEFYMNRHRDRKINPNITPPDFSTMPEDPNEQTKQGWIENGNKALNLNFAGQNSGSYPPDCNGTVGPNHYFQVVNTTYAIYNKSGSLVAGPSALNSIFDSGLPGAGCNDGDPIVLWDEHANRWFYSEFSLCGSNDYMLIAVSTSSDPTGTWYSWSFDVDDTPDYMKFGIWQDGYYMATNTGNGDDVYVFERDAMIAGDPNPTMIGFDNPNRPSTFDGFHCIMPLDNDGPWAPSGTPGQFITIADDGQSNPSDALWIYELDVNWTSPSSSSFTRTQTLNVNSFSGNFTNNWNNIPQPGTSQKLDAISTVLMYRAQYRNFGGTQKIVCVHSIAESSSESALRWYELENNGSGWSISQQGTYNPDNVSRWNASIAMNELGQIAMGYSVSDGSSTYPGIRYCGQTNGAPDGVMDIAETTIWDGSYSQSSYNRWGDYANISVDPSDGETFWFTSEYKSASSHGTRIASFTLGASSNQAPVAEANGPYSGEAGVAVSFSSSGSYDNDGTIVSYYWNFGDGNSSTSANPTHTYSSAGNYTVSLTVTDDGGKTGSDNADVTISAGAASYASLPYSTGFESGFDLNWSTQGNTSYSRIQITSANTPHSGSYHLTMDVTTNGNYNTNEAWMGLNLSGQTQVDLSFWWKDFSDETHSTDGVYFSDNGGASFVKVQDLNGQSYTNNTWTQFNLDVDQLAASNGLSLSSTFVVKFQQYDNYAITTDGMAFDDISVTGSSGNVAPVAEANGPYSGTEDQAISFSSSGSSDSDGTITSYYWEFGDGGTSTSANPSHTYTSPGNYTAVLTVTDDGGLTDSDNASVTVNAANVAPVAEANGPYNGTAGQSVSFSSSGSSDSDGTITSYYWEFGDGATSTNANPSHTYASAGNFTATLTVTDDGGLTDSDNASVTIDPATGGDYASLPYSTGFESGLDDNWSTQGSTSYSRIQVTSSNTPHSGSYHLTMDVTTNGNYNTNEAWMGLNLAGETQVDMTFWWKDFSDETHSTDGVYFSDNGGSTFTKVLNLNGGSYANNTWNEFTLDVDQLAASNGLSLTSTFVVKFQQYDNYAITTDGMAFDDISVTSGGSGGDTDPPTGYCASSGNNSSYEWIDLVQLGTINNTSGNDGGYADYTSQETDLINGTQYTINFSCGFSSSSYTEFWHVFIDYNRDGDFNDSGEEVVTGSSSSSGTLSGTFTVPSSTSEGYARMRVSMKWDAAAGPCENFSYGEVEDYLVYLTPSARNKQTIVYESGFEIGFENNMYTIYPNPASEHINIRLPENSKVKVTITTVNGKFVKEKMLENNESIKISDLNSGIYIIKIDDGRKTSVERFVKY